MFVLWVVSGVWWFIRGFLIIGWGAPSSAGRLGASRASPNTPAGRQGAVIRSAPGKPPSGTIRVAQAKSSGSDASGPSFDAFGEHMRFR